MSQLIERAGCRVLTLEICGAQLECEFEFWPPEPETHDEPGDSGSCVLLGAVINGRFCSDLDSLFSGWAVSQLEEMAFEQLVGVAA